MNPVHSLAEAPAESSPSLVPSSSPLPGPAAVSAASGPVSVLLPPPISPSSPPPSISTPVQSLAILASAHHQQQQQQQQQSQGLIPGSLPRPDEAAAAIASAAAATPPPQHFFQPPSLQHHHQHQSHHAPSAMSSTPPRKDTASSISTQATSATQASTETTNTSYSSDTSPTLHQSIFSLKDGTDVSNSRRTSRRRTGPLSQQSRERAALIRKLGACTDCRRRRVACKPSHHNMTWEDVVNKFHRSHSPSIHDLAPSLVPGRPLSPAPVPSSSQHMFSHNPHEMEIDSGSPSNHPNRPPPSDSRHRTPLPSGPRLEKSLSLPGIETLKNELQSNALRMLSTTCRSRYTAVQALLLFWQDDDDDVAAIHHAIGELADVLEKHYHYGLQIEPIPSSSDGSRSSWRWLSRKMSEFAENRDQRDVLKIVYYIGHTFLDGNREMVLASSRDNQKASIIRWNGIQQILEEAYADTLLIMDAAYYPSSRMGRERGVLELIAASTSDEYYLALNRCAFTLALTDLLRTQASRMQPCSAAELHSALLSNYPNMVRDRNPEREVVTSFPAPLHTMMSGNSRLPSIFITPLSPPGNPLRNSLHDNSPILNMSIRLANEDDVDLDSWNEWLRLMPEGVRDVKVEGPFRSTFR